MMNSEEEYINQIELLKQALQFYANKENYLFFKDKDAPIALDEGSQARFALKLLQDNIDLNQKMSDDYIKNISEKVVKEETQEGILRLMEEIKKVGDGDV